jgi:hypothetical protein
MKKDLPLRRKQGFSFWIKKKGKVLKVELKENLNEVRKTYSTYDVEFYAILQALRHWRHYLVPKEFVLFTDHIVLKYVNTQNKLNNRHAKWVSFLQGYIFVLKHKSGRHNQVVVALSRHTILLTTMEN